MWLPTKAQVDAATRHAVTIAGTAIAIFGLQAKGISVEQVTAAIQSLGTTVNSLVVLLAAVAPLYAMTRASQSASPTNQIASVQAIATGPASATAADAQKALVQATSAIAQDPTIPASTDAKVALIDATAALPEVVGDIKVTDPAIAMATVSDQVKPA